MRYLMMAFVVVVNWSAQAAEVKPEMAMALMDRDPGKCLVAIEGFEATYTTIKWIGTCQGGRAEGVGTVDLGGETTQLRMTGLFENGYATGLMEAIVFDDNGDIAGCAIDLNDLDRPSVCWSSRFGIFSGDLRQFQ